MRRQFFHYSSFIFLLIICSLKSFGQQQGKYISTQKTTICAGDSVLLSGPKRAIGLGLTSTLSGGNYANGNMFTIKAKQSIVIDSFTLNTNADSSRYRVYYKTGTYTGFENDSTAWTFLGQANNVDVASTTFPATVTLPLAINLCIEKGDSLSFYISSTVRNHNLEYTDGTNLGAVYAQNTELEFYEGIGKRWPFGSNYRPRIWNGIIHYSQPNLDLEWFDKSIDTFVWAKPSVKTKYGLKLTNTCDSAVIYDTVEIDVQHASVPNIADTSVCQDSSISINPGTVPNGITYSWDHSSTVSNGIASYNSGGRKFITATTSIGCQAVDSFEIELVSTPTPKLGNDTSFCDGAAINLNASVTDSRAKYSWNNQHDSQFLLVDKSGIFSVEVEVLGCVGTDEIEVTVHQNPMVVLRHDTSICNGDSVVLNAGKHANMPSFFWNNVAGNQFFTAKMNGIYVVKVVDTNGCDNSDSFSLGVNPVPVIPHFDTTNFCTGDSVLLEVGAANEGSTIKWSTNQTSQSIVLKTEGYYTVSVTNQFNCRSSAGVQLFERSLPYVNLGTDTIVCEDSLFTIDAGNHLKYRWSTGETTRTIKVKEGLYSVTVTSPYGCENTAYKKLTEFPLPIAKFTAEHKGHRRYLFSASFDPFTSYLWKLGDGNTSTAPWLTHQYDSDGEKTIVLLADNQCGVDSMVSKVQVNASIQEIEQRGWSVYPNPNQGQFTISFTKEIENGHLIITTATGQIISQDNLKNAMSGAQLRIELPSGTHGVYMLQIVTNGRAAMQFVCVE
ncbi:MAG: T9SS type A sorting domain-containing protein [Bacteroidetes bacterium]|nr:T9SS type A sorting domain-containing protein [Bacteroidota bacterium]